jgi:uncharacterized protein (DUF1330 family)
MGGMTSYAVAHMRTVDLNEQIVEYLHRIDATLEPFGGRFVVHGPELQVLEGEWPGTLIVIEFPGDRSAREWYHSAAYQQIIKLRTDNSVSDVVITQGVEQPHRATDVL